MKMAVATTRPKLAHSPPVAAEVLVVLGYADQGGVGVIRSAVDTGAFDRFVLGDGMFAQSLIDAIGDDLEGTIGVVPGVRGAKVRPRSPTLPRPPRVNPSASYTGESYDAAALIALAIPGRRLGRPHLDPRQPARRCQRAWRRDPARPAGPVAWKILAEGGEVNYVGGTNVELIGPGEASGSYRQ